MIFLEYFLLVLKIQLESNIKWSGTQEFKRVAEKSRIFTHILERKRKQKKKKKDKKFSKMNGDYDDNTSIIVAIHCFHWMRVCGSR